MINDKISKFVSKLSKRESNDQSFNQYENHDPYNNLLVYLNYVYECRAEILLIGEAPGHRGAKLSGIPFTSNYIMKTNRLFLKIRNNLSYQESPKMKEATATMVYSFFNKHPKIFQKFLFWNAFPFHPYKENNLKSNRSPNRQEIIEGQDYIIDLFDIFEFKMYYPVGNMAFKTLREMQDKNMILLFNMTKITHPSNGHKKDFIRGMKKVLNLKDKTTQTSLLKF